MFKYITVVDAMRNATVQAVDTIPHEETKKVMKSYAETQYDALSDFVGKIDAMAALFVAETTKFSKAFA